MGTLKKWQTCLTRVFRDISIWEHAVQQRYLRGTLFDVAYFAGKNLRRQLGRAAGQARGVLLDIGCGNKRYLNVFESYIDRYYGLDYPPTMRNRDIDPLAADIYGDALRLPIGSGSVNTILLTQVLEHLTDPGAAIREAYRVLADDGVLVITAPFLYPVHGAPDNYRFTQYGLQTLVHSAGFDVIYGAPLGSFWSFLMTSLNTYIRVHLPGTNRLLNALAIILWPLLLLTTFMINLLGLILERIHEQANYAIDVIVIAQK